MKRDLYEGGVRVPLIAWGPGSIEAGGESAHVSAFQDFLPTAAELAGVAAPAGIDGISYAPTLMGKADEQKKHDYLFWKFRAKVAVRQDKWKAVRTKKDGAVELYDLSSAIGEQHNVADKHPQVVRQLLKFMQQHQKSVVPGKPQR